MLKKKQTLLFSFFLVLLLPLLSAVQIDIDTITYSSLSNSTIQFEQNTTLDQLTVDNNKTILFNIGGDYKFTNINATYSAQMQINNLTNAIVYSSDGTLYGNSDISSNDVQINATFLVSTYLGVLDNFNLTEGVTRDNSPLSLTTTSSFNSEAYDSKTYAINSDISSSLSGITFVTNTTSCPQTGDTVQVDGVSSTFSCSDNNVLVTLSSIDLGSNNLVITYNKDPQAGGGGGTTTGPVVVEGNNTIRVCELTYDAANSNDVSQIDSIRSTLSSENITESWSSVREYIVNWQTKCSDLLGKSIEPDKLCEKIYFFRLNNPNFSESSFQNFETELNVQLPISYELLVNYFNEYEKLCVDLGYSDALPIDDLPEFIKILDKKLQCNISMNKFFEQSFFFFDFSLGELSCSQVKFWSYIFELEEFDEVYMVRQIKIWWILSSMVLFIIVFMFLIPNKKMDKWLHLNLKR